MDKVGCLTSINLESLWNFRTINLILHVSTQYYADDKHNYIGTSWTGTNKMFKATYFNCRNIIEGHRLCIKYIM